MASVVDATGSDSSADVVTQVAAIVPLSRLRNSWCEPLGSSLGNNGEWHVFILCDKIAREYGLRVMNLNFVSSVTMSYSVI